MGFGGPRGFEDPGGFRVWESWWVLGITVGFGGPGRFCGSQQFWGSQWDFGDHDGFQGWSHCKQESLGTSYSMNTEAELKQGTGIMGPWNC